MPVSSVLYSPTTQFILGTSGVILQRRLTGPTSRLYSAGTTGVQHNSWTAKSEALTAELPGDLQSPRKFHRTARRKGRPAKNLQGDQIHCIERQLGVVQEVKGADTEGQKGDAEILSSGISSRCSSPLNLSSGPASPIYTLLRDQQVIQPVHPCWLLASAPLPYDSTSSCHPLQRVWWISLLVSGRLSLASGSNGQPYIEEIGHILVVLQVWLLELCSGHLWVLQQTM